MIPEPLDVKKKIYQAAMRKIVNRLEDRIKHDTHCQSIEAMKEDLWRSQIEIQEVLKNER